MNYLFTILGLFHVKHICARFITIKSVFIIHKYLYFIYFGVNLNIIFTQKAKELYSLDFLPSISILVQIVALSARKSPNQFRFGLVLWAGLIECLASHINHQY